MKLNTRERLTIYIEALSEYSSGGLCTYFQWRGILNWEEVLPELKDKVTVDVGAKRFNSRNERLEALQKCIVELSEWILAWKIAENKPD